MKRLLSFVFAGLAVFLLSLPLMAQEHAPEHIVGVRMVGGMHFVENHGSGLAGVGVSVEEAMFHHLFEIEAVGTWVQVAGHNGVEGELLLKVPFQVTKHLDIYGGGGGIVEAFEHVRPGVVLDVGSRLWSDSGWGVGVEFDYVTVMHSESQETVEGILDLMVRF